MKLPVRASNPETDDEDVMLLDADGNPVDVDDVVAHLNASVRPEDGGITQALVQMARDAAIEECAAVCDKYTTGQQDVSTEFAMGIEQGAMKCANAIRALTHLPQRESGAK